MPGDVSDMPADAIHHPHAQGGVLGDGERTEHAGLGRLDAAVVAQDGEVGHLIDERGIPPDEWAGMDQDHGITCPGQFVDELDVVVCDPAGLAGLHDDPLVAKFAPYRLE